MVKLESKEKSEREKQSMSYESLQGLRHPSPTHHPPSNQHFSKQKAKATMDKREELSDTHKNSNRTRNSRLSLYQNRN